MLAVVSGHAPVLRQILAAVQIMKYSEPEGTSETEVLPVASPTLKYGGFPVYNKYDVILYVTFSVHKRAAVINRSAVPTTLDKGSKQIEDNLAIKLRNTWHIYRE
jgi:hypothetical protein